jgi:hypothetical protein
VVHFLPKNIARSLKNCFSKVAQKCPDARRPKSFVGNGFKPFPTTYVATTKDEGNAADACLPVGRGVFQQPLRKKEVS